MNITSFTPLGDIPDLPAPPEAAIGAPSTDARGLRLWAKQFPDLQYTPSYTDGAGLVSFMAFTRESATATGWTRVFTVSVPWYTSAATGRAVRYTLTVAQSVALSIPVTSAEVMTASLSLAVNLATVPWGYNKSFLPYSDGSVHELAGQVSGVIGAAWAVAQATPSIAISDPVYDTGQLIISP
jgi:hypothetical protein